MKYTWKEIERNEHMEVVSIVGLLIVIVGIYFLRALRVLNSEVENNTINTGDN